MAQPGVVQSPTAGLVTSDIRIGPEHADAAPALDGERKIVTALFADIKGSTELERDLDPEEARAIVDPVLRLMMDAVHRYGGYVAQSTGDGIFALFGAPVAHEDHPQRALHAALAMQEELRQYGERLKSQSRSSVEVRIGVNTGRVVVRTIETGGHTEYTPIGHVTNLAARMQTSAPSGSIAASEATRRLCEGYFEFRALGPTAIKGLEVPVEVHEVVRAGPLRTHFELSARRGLTRFVGREREMAAIRTALEQARVGHGQVVAVVAEAGTGKSRLVYEFRATIPEGLKVLEAYSVSHGKGSAWLPVLELLRGYFVIQDGDATSRHDKVRAAVAGLDPALSDTLPYLWGLLGIQESPDPLAQMDAQIKRRRTLEALKRILLRESLKQPLVVIFEDLHWIDEQTQEFLNLLAGSIGTAKVLLLVNYRPEYSHQWGSKTYYTQLRLDPLERESAEEMLSALLGDNRELAPLRRLIIERTEGTPFFMEETVQVLLDDGSLVRNGAAKLTRPLSELKIPPTVQAILASRIDRLPSDVKELLHALAIIGREFPLSLVRAVVTKSDDELRRILNDLQLNEFVYEQPAVGDTEYVFKHALTQEVAYDSVLIERRKQLHEHIGAALERLYVSSLDDHLAELAHHYGRGNNPEKAVQYLARAGKQSLGRSAFAEAQAQLQRGLDLIKLLPESAGRDAQELELASTLAQVLLLIRGFSAPEARAAATRATALAEKSGNLTQLVVQTYGLWRSHFYSGDYSNSVALADRILSLAEREGSATSLGLACRVQIEMGLGTGNLAGVENYFDRLTGCLEAAGFRQFPGAAIGAIGIAGLAALIEGHADRARDRIAQAFAFARDSKKPYDLAVAGFFDSFVSYLLREPQRSAAAATRALALCEEHGFAVFKEFCRAALGSAQAQLGRPGEGISFVRQSLASLAEIGLRVTLTDPSTRLAEAQALDGKIEDALGTLEDALAAAPEEVVFQPNVLTRRGELRLKQGHSQPAEADFRDGIALAQKMQAKTWELRATTSLARLLRDTDRRDEVRTMLADIYNWFTEGFDTADLKDAKALLDELSN
jgi:class 3 adenylate cyclase/tetratricopeptide (TPR) repeat protein